MTPLLLVNSEQNLFETLFQSGINSDKSGGLCCGLIPAMGSSEALTFFVQTAWDEFYP